MEKKRDLVTWWLAYFKIPLSNWLNYQVPYPESIWRSRERIVMWPSTMAFFLDKFLQE